MSSPSNLNKYANKLLESNQRSSTESTRPSAGRVSANYAEQQPAMRSVAVAPHVSQHRILHFEPALKRAEPCASGLQPLQRSLRGVSEPELIKTATRPVLKRVVASESALARKWHVEHTTLPFRTDDLPPLRSSRLIRDTQASVIAERIANRLTSRSIKAKFSKTEDNVTNCRNTDFCKFTIRLYKGEDGNGVLVEVQRICGDGVSFIKDFRAILDAAEGKTDESKEEVPLYLRLPVSKMSFIKDAKMPEITPEDNEACCNITANLLSSPRSDSNMLGIENLACQTDPLKTLKSTALIASRRVLCPHDPHNKEFNIHNYVMSLCLYGTEESETSPFVDTALEDHHMKLRNLAMLALSNALALFSSEDLLLSTISPNLEWYTSVLVPNLVDALSAAADHPHDACYASRCLGTLGKAHSDFASKMKEVGLQCALEQAEKVGQSQFQMLYQELGNAQRILKPCCV